DVDRPSLRLIDVDQREQHIELVALLGALRRAPTGFDLGERYAMVFVGANWPDVHGGLLRNATLSVHRCGHIPRECRRISRTRSAGGNRKRPPSDNFPPQPRT